MRKPTRIETWFTDEQISELRSKLDLDRLDNPDAYTQGFVVIISERFETCWRHLHFRKEVGSESEAREKLRQISALSKQLARLLSKEPALTNLVFPRERIRRERQGRPGMSLDLIKRVGTRPTELLEDLKVISEQALRHAEDRSTFTKARQILPDIQLIDDEMAVASKILWPELLEIWEAVGKRIATTENGPLHRFINFVHSVANLPPSSRSTLRDAIARWKRNMADE